MTELSPTGRRGAYLLGVNGAEVSDRGPCSKYRPHCIMLALITSGLWCDAEVLCGGMRHNLRTLPSRPPCPGGGGRRYRGDDSLRRETAVLLHPPLPLVGVSIGMERGCQHNDSTLADG